MNKLAHGAGHYDGANCIPKQYLPAGIKSYSEGTTMRKLVNRMCAAQPSIYNFRPEAGTSNPWHPNFSERAKRIAAANCTHAIEDHTNWSIGSSGKPNRGTFLVIVSLCYDKGIYQAQACAEQKELATKLLKPLADQLGLRFEIRTKKGSGKWDWYSFINYTRKYKIPFGWIVENGYHLDFAEHLEEYMEKIVAFQTTLLQLLGIPTADIPAPDPVPVIRFTTTKDCYTQWAVHNRFRVSLENVRLDDGTPMGKVVNPGAMRPGMKLLILNGTPAPEPIHFTTTKDCYTQWAVHKKFNVPLEHVRLDNGTLNGADLNPKAMWPGMKLLILR